MKTALLKIISFYQKIFSPDHGVFKEIAKQKGWGCRFHPTCSQYFYQSIEKYGTTRGIFMGLKRIGRCNPFHSGGFDPLP